MTEASCLQSRVGTELYLAPEVKGVFPPEMDDTSATYTYSEKVDIWSLGILTFHMLFHDHPFTSKKPLELRKYINGGPFPFPASPSQQVSQHSTNFILAALARVAPERSSAQKLLVSDWMKQRSSDYVTEMRNLSLARETTPETVQNTYSGTSQPHKSVRSKTKESIQRKDDPVENIATPSEGHFALNSKRSPSLRPPPNPTESTESDNLTQLKASHDKGMLAYNSKDYKSAEKFLLRAFEGRRAATGPESTVTLLSQSNLAAVYHEQSRFTEAESLLRAVLKAQRKTLGPKHVDMIYPLVLLSETLESLGQDSQAMVLEEEIGEICKIISQNNSKDEQRSSEPEIKGNKNIGTVQSSSPPSSRSLTLKNTSSKGGDRSQYHTAFQMTQDKRAPALLSREKLSADRDRAYGLFKEGKSQQAVHLFEQILGDQIESLDQNDEDVVDTLHLLGRGFFEGGEYDNAATCFNEVLESRIQSFPGTDHETIADSWQWLGISRYRDERYDEAVISLEHAVKEWESLNHDGSYDERMWESLRWLGWSFAKIGKLSKAEHVASRLVRSKKRALGLTHGDTLDAWYNLITIYDEQSKYLEVENETYQLLQIQRETLGPNHESTVRSLEKIVSIFFRTAEDGGAKHSYNEQIETTVDELSKCRAAILGPAHKDTLSILQCLGIIQKKIQKLPEAEETLFRASRGQKETLGLGHEETINSLWWLAETLRDRGSYRWEVDVRKDVLDGHLILFGDTHEKTLKAQDEHAAANKRYSNSLADVKRQPAFIQKASMKMKTLRNRWERI